MDINQIRERLIRYGRSGKKIFVTSSFQTHSIPLLHIISRTEVEVDVFFINTGFHFPETMSFKNDVAKLLDLNIIDVLPVQSKHLQRDRNGHFYFVSDPDYCCFLNKVQPLEPILQMYDVWISGVRADQSAERKSMKTEQSAQFNTIRFHPMLDWTMKQIYEYRKRYDLPDHPLDKKGYQSIGCSPCTRTPDSLEGRDGRWFGMTKTECGLHTDLISE